MNSLLAILILLQSDPQGDALRTIDEAVLKTHEAYLASDALEGRAAGFPGNEKAVDYVVAELKSFGLKAAGIDGYCQEFEFRAGGETRRAKNIVAVLEGSDATLKSEYVLIGAHVDHVGKRGQNVSGRKDGPRDGDEIWNGADDNASGTAAVLAVARAFGRGTVRPKRSILFAWWNAEEAGLLGSAWWAGHPTVPIDKVTYCLDLDMVGRNPERPMDVEGVKNAEGDALERILSTACASEDLKITKYDHSNEAMFRSDGASFLEQGIPATMFFTYWHADYHGVADHAEKIAYPRLAKVSRASYRIMLEVANTDPGLKINPDTPLRGRSLQIRGEDVSVEGGAGGIKVAFVASEGSFGKAGLKVNDLIVGYGTRSLSAARPMADLWRQVQFGGAESQEVIVLRAGQKLVLTVSWKS